MMNGIGIKRIIKGGMRLLSILAVLAWTSASAGESPCAADTDCATLGIGYQCIAQKTACAVHPESSTCVERICRKKPGGPVRDEDRVCRKDADCAIVLLECRCMYCARAEDFQAGIVAAVSKGRLKAYEALGKCSQTQQHQCAMAGACAMTGASEARCRANHCFVEYVPRIEP
jgi:hypothetical protein